MPPLNIKVKGQDQPLLHAIQVPVITNLRNTNERVSAPEFLGPRPLPVQILIYPGVIFKALIW